MTVHEGSRVDKSLLPPPRSFYERNVQRFRPAGSKARSKCPFHVSDSRSKSVPFAMDLSTGLFHCFSCNASGDIVQFVMLRDEVDFVGLCKRLGVWRSADDPAEAKALRRAREARQAGSRAKEDAYVKSVEKLAKEMELQESLLHAAEATGDAERAAIAQEQIDHLGGRFLLLKIEHDCGPPPPEEAISLNKFDKHDDAGKARPEND